MDLRKRGIAAYGVRWQEETWVRVGVVALPDACAQPRGLVLRWFDERVRWAS